jgi:hypothetical protein
MSRAIAGSVMAVLLTLVGSIFAAAVPPEAQAQDVMPPRAPSSVSATADGLTITVKWAPARDDVGVTSYVIQRCEGAGCASFTRIATTVGTVTTYADNGLAANTTYSYRVRGVDAAGNLGRFSAVATATTGSAGSPPPPASGQSLSPRAVALTAAMTQQFTSAFTRPNWSVDGIKGGSAAVGTISATGLYTAPSQPGKHTVTAKTGGRSATATVYITNHPGVFTHHNDNLRTGQNQNETVLTPANVSPATFGKLFSYSLDGIAYASPLYVANVNIRHLGARNVVYVATEHNSVYAFDADGRQGAPLWRVSFINPAAGITTVPAGDTLTLDIAPEVGITGTPVIDSASRTLYVVAATREGSGNNRRYVQRLHALDLATGAEKFGGPVEIVATVVGLGEGSQGGQLAFDPLVHNQRAALLLSNGVVYIAFGSHGDQGFYHGWVLGYEANTLEQVMAFNVTPNGIGAGIWQGGGGLAADAVGNIYFATGNGTFDVNTGGVNYGDSFIKLSPAGKVLDFFTPHDQATLENGDIDLGSGALMLIPAQGAGIPLLMVGAGKDGTMYLVNRNKMGHYNPNNDNQVVQSLVSIFSANFGAPVYFNRSVYFSGVVATIKAFSLVGGMLSVGPTSGSSESYNFPGAGLSLSANGTSDGILWAVQRNSSSPGVLHAYDATNLGNTLYSSDASGFRDSMDAAAKFSVPLVVNGKVFVGSMSRLTAFGLLP